MIFTDLWLLPHECQPPHRVTHIERLEAIQESLHREGWRDGEPACLGYWFDSYVQLLSGSHRWAACQNLKQRLPVRIFSYDYVMNIAGSDEWVKLLQMPPIVGQDFHEHSPPRS